MFVMPDNSRLSHLKLSGFQFGTVVQVCPLCDFQRAYESSPAVCRRCGTTLAEVLVTKELARAAA